MLTDMIHTVHMIQVAIAGAVGKSCGRVNQR